MAVWFKTKNKQPVTSDIPSNLLALVRTMKDDLSGAPAPEMKSAQANEPLVQFRPGSSTGAPFFAAPGVTETKEAPVSREASPFLASPEEAASDDSAPTFDPPLEPVRPQPAVRAQAPANLPLSDGSEPVQLKRMGDLPGISFREKVAGLGQRLKPKGEAPSRKKWLILGISVALLLVIALVWFFFLRPSSDSISTLSTENVLPPAKPEATLTGEPLETHYKASATNTLTVNTETVTEEEIKRMLLQVSQSVIQDKLPGAIQFEVRDQNGNILAFSRFAYLARLSLPETLLSTLDEAFNLYVFIDDGRPRLGLKLAIKNETAFADHIPVSERTLGVALEPLFLDTTTAPKNNLVFRSSSYLERPVRFANVDETINLSVDYAVRGKNWVIGTSKDSLRAVLDRNGL